MIEGSVVSVTPALVNRRAFVVEDDPVFQESIALALSHLDSGWSLEIAEDGATALSRLSAAESVPDIVLVDLGLPDMTGVEIIHAARSRFSEVPIMVVSVIAVERVLIEAIRAGARGYLLKGESIVSLARSIDQVMRGEYPISPALARYLFKQAGSPGSGSAVIASPGIALSPKELALLKLIAQGRSYAESAKEMAVSVSTIQTHIRNMYRKLDVHSQAQAISTAREQGLL